MRLSASVSKSRPRRMLWKVARFLSLLDMFSLHSFTIGSIDAVVLVGNACLLRLRRD
jgi:hypothetical protein